MNFRGILKRKPKPEPESRIEFPPGIDPILKSMLENVDIDKYTAGVKKGLKRIMLKSMLMTWGAWLVFCPGAIVVKDYIPESFRLAWSIGTLVLLLVCLFAATSWQRKANKKFLDEQEPIVMAGMSKEIKQVIEDYKYKMTNMPKIMGTIVDQIDGRRE